MSEAGWRPDSNPSIFPFHFYSFSFFPLSLFPPFPHFSGLVAFLCLPLILLFIFFVLFSSPSILCLSSPFPSFHRFIRFPLSRSLSLSQFSVLSFSLPFPPYSLSPFFQISPSPLFSFFLFKPHIFFNLLSLPYFNPSQPSLLSSPPPFLYFALFSHSSSICPRSSSSFFSPSTSLSLLAFLLPFPNLFSTFPSLPHPHSLPLPPSSLP